MLRNGTDPNTTFEEKARRGGWSTVLPRDLLLLSLLPATLFAQDAAGLTGPSLGYVYEQGAVRSVLGIPGASLLGTPLALEAAIDTAAVSPRHNYVLGLLRETREAALFRIPAERLDPVSIPGLNGRFARFLLSPRGEAAALIAEDESRAEVVLDLYTQPRIAATANLEGARVLAVSDAGDLVVAASGDEEIVSVIEASGERKQLGSAGKAAAAVYVAGTGDLFVADSATGRLLSVRDGRLETVIEHEQLRSPVALIVSDGIVYISTAEPDGVLQVSLNGADPKFVACPARPSLVAPMMASGIFRLNESGAGPIYLLDARNADPAILFVPAGGLQ